MGRAAHIGEIIATFQPNVVAVTSKVEVSKKVLLGHFDL